jgi:hypothetical protein
MFLLMLCDYVGIVLQVVDPHKASYGVDNAMYAVGQLAQTTMRRCDGCTRTVGRDTQTRCDWYCHNGVPNRTPGTSCAQTAWAAGESHGVYDANFAVTRCCCLSCSELGKITLDKTFEERETLNLAIVLSINGAAEAWGLQCLRYEIKDITPPSGV